jgi:hypothetical protein
MMGNAMKTPAFNSGQPVFIQTPTLTAAQLQEQLK